MKSDDWRMKGHNGEEMHLEETWRYLYIEGWVREFVSMVQIIKVEAGTSGCDIDWRVNKYGILLKTYQGGRVVLAQETGL